MLATSDALLRTNSTSGEAPRVVAFVHNSSGL